MEAVGGELWLGSNSTFINAKYVNRLYFDYKWEVGRMPMRFRLKTVAWQKTGLKLLTLP